MASPFDRGDNLAEGANGAIRRFGDAFANVSARMFRHHVLQLLSTRL